MIGQGQGKGEGGGEHGGGRELGVCGEGMWALPAAVDTVIEMKRPSSRGVHGEDGADDEEGRY